MKIISILMLFILGISSFASAKVIEAKMNHVGISVGDIKKEQDWYQKSFNMKIEQEFSIPQPPIKSVLLRAENGFRIELIERKGAKRDREFKDAMDATLSLGVGHFALEVQNLDEVFATLKANGVVEVSAPASGASKGWRFAYVKDPEGNLIELLQISK